MFLTLLLFSIVVSGDKYLMRRGQWVMLTFNGDPDVTDNWNAHYMFDGMSIGSLDGNPLIFRDTLGDFYVLHWAFGFFERQRGRDRYLDYIHRNNYTMQIVTHFMSHTDDGRVTRLLMPHETPEISHRPDLTCMCINQAGEIIYNFRSTR